MKNYKKLTTIFKKKKNSEPISTFEEKYQKGKNDS